MKKSTILWLTALIAILSVGSGCPKVEVVCEEGETQEGFCPDGTQSTQSCLADGSGWEMCDCPKGNSPSDLGSDEGIEWCDTETGLCWQDPPYQKERGLCWEAANDYCDELSFDGHDDWRLPNINELRTLLVGCPNTEDGGACPVKDGSGWGDMDVETCASCVTGEAADEGELGLYDCYWDSELQGTCNRDTEDDPAVEYWTSSPNVDDPEIWAAFIHFGSGIIGYNHTVSWGDVRCVRDKTSTEGDPVCAPNDTKQCTCDDEDTGAQKCSYDGSSWGSCVCIGPDDIFENECPSYEGGLKPEDCNPISVTVTAPDNFPGNPFSLTGHIYTEDRCCPPNGPPDGGWTIYENPGLTADTPYVMDVYGIDIARSECLPPGYYWVLITVAMREDDPMQLVDWQGISAETVELGKGDVDGVEIELIYVGE
jgi:hypothetical protein